MSSCKRISEVEKVIFFTKSDDILTNYTLERQELDVFKKILKRGKRIKTTYRKINSFAPPLDSKGEVVIYFKNDSLIFHYAYGIFYNKGEPYYIFNEEVMDSLLGIQSSGLEVPTYNDLLYTK